MNMRLPGLFVGAAFFIKFGYSEGEKRSAVGRRRERCLSAVLFFLKHLFGLCVIEQFSGAF